MLLFPNQILAWWCIVKVLHLILTSPIEIIDKKRFNRISNKIKKNRLKSWKILSFELSRWELDDGKNRWILSKNRLVLPKQQQKKKNPQKKSIHEENQSIRFELHTLHYITIHWKGAIVRLHWLTLIITITRLINR